MNKGFTIVELMVSITIMALMAGTVFFNWRPTEETFSLIRSAHQLSDDLRRAQQMAVSTRAFVCSEIDSDYSGYGIYLNTSLPTQYYLFENCSNANWSYGDLEDEKLEIQSLEDGVEIESITVGEGVTSASILFIPPNPTIYINDVNAGVEAVITLRLSNDISRTKQVKINTGGRIEIN